MDGETEMQRRSITGLQESDRGASRDQWGVGPIASWVTKENNTSQTESILQPGDTKGGAVGARPKKNRATKLWATWEYFQNISCILCIFSLAITALRASPDEKTVVQKKKKDTWKLAPST